MQVKIVFDNSGDEITFDAVNPELVEYYTNNIQQAGFTLASPFRIPGLLSELDNVIEDVNKITYKILGTRFNKESFLLNYLDQTLLNYLHAEFVKSQELLFDIQQNRKNSNLDIRQTAETLHHMCPDEITHVTFGEILDKLGDTGPYGKLNDTIHLIENSFRNIQFRTEQWVSFLNPFPKNILTNDLFNLQLTFNHHGRTQFNKFRNFDTKLEFDDENNYNQLLGYVSIRLAPAETTPVPIEYVNWCKKLNREPIGNYLNIGIIPDLANNLTKYRQLLYKNLKIQNKFTIHKG